MKTGPVWFDKDAAQFLGLSVATLRRRLAHPVAGELDLNKAEPKIIGGRRLWLRERIEKLIGMKG